LQRPLREGGAWMRRLLRWCCRKRRVARRGAQTSRYKIIEVMAHSDSGLREGHRASDVLTAKLRGIAQARYASEAIAEWRRYNPNQDFLESGCTVLVEKAVFSRSVRAVADEVS
jgi:hypothetical protein